jgi:hypothetical protein
LYFSGRTVAARKTSGRYESKSEYGDVQVRDVRRIFRFTRFLPVQVRAEPVFDPVPELSVASSSYSRYQSDLAGAPKSGGRKSGSGRAFACGKVGRKREASLRYPAATIQKSNLRWNKL